MIDIPESIAFYWSDAANRAAVNVLATRGDVPPDLSLAEAEQFELAVLAARRVQIEFWQLLRRIWSATWQAAVEAEIPAARLLSFGGHRDYPHEESVVPSVENAWGERATYGIFNLPDGNQLVTCAKFGDRDQELELWFYVADAEADTSVSDALDLEPGWGDDGEGRRKSATDIMRLVGVQGSIDLEPLVSLSRSAITALVAAQRATS